MNKFNPSIQQAPTTIIKASSPKSALSGMSLSEVINACMQKITSGTGAQRAATGELFLNLLTPKLFAADINGTKLHNIPQMYANFDNRKDSVAVTLAQLLSKELLETGTISPLQYYFKLIDAKTKVTIASDLPEREVVETESTVPDFLKVESNTVAYIPRPNVAAYLHIYAEYDGKPVRIASSDIESRFVDTVQHVGVMVEKGHHIQAGVVPMAKVEAWLEERAEQEDNEATASFLVAEAEQAKADLNY